ncbi:MAG: thioredoxin domain-containing protein [bacterium]|nr:thioredoxin domain-containing protein [bacterium]
MTNNFENPELKNELGKASSSYLKSAADQPVYWQEWNDELFKLAEILDKPVLLDIGAVWCHWCHVMDRESYENRETADLINENFIPVKVDRDERPDVDRRYQTFVQAMGGGGGWPLTCFLTYEGKLFFGGTYFPPVDTNGRPGFNNLLKKIIEMYRSRKSDIISNSREIFANIKEHEDLRNNPSAISIDLVQQIALSVEQNFDPVYGGIGIAPKFPNSSAIGLVMLYYNMTKDPKYLEIVRSTLDKMADGGIYDHVGGGFHRYSVDQYWHVPHFEKMTTDNAELLRNYLEFYKITGDEKYKKTALGILDWYERDMTDHVSGGFFAHQDADINLDDDGDYFTWRKDELEKILSPEEQAVYFEYYGISQSPCDLHGTTDRNVLYSVRKLDQIADELSITSADVESIINSVNNKVLEIRYTRTAPFIDKTIFSSYNGMMLASYAYAYKILRDVKIYDFFLKTLEFIIGNMYNSSTGFAHSYTSGKPEINGLLADQVWMANALLDGFEITTDPKYFDLAKQVIDMILEKYEDRKNGGFFDRIIDSDESGILSLKQKPFEDIPSSSSNAIAVRTLNRLYSLTGIRKYRDAARRTLESYAGNIQDNGTYVGAYGIALYLHLYPPPQIVITGNNTEPATKELYRTCMDNYIPFMEIYNIDQGKNDIDMLPFSLKEKVLSRNLSVKPAAFSCSGNSCSAPTGDPAELEKTLILFRKQQRSNEDEQG